MNEIVAMVMQFGDWIATHGPDIQEGIQDFFKIITSVINAIISVFRFIHNNWDFISALFFGIKANLIPIIGALEFLFDGLKALMQAIAGLFEIVHDIAEKFDFLGSIKTPSETYSLPSTRTLTEPRENVEIGPTGAKLLGPSNASNTQNVWLDIHNELKKHGEKLDSIVNATSNTADASNRTSRLTKQIAQTA
jgi:hypothetical protein